MLKMKELKLTPLEMDIFNYRLEVPCAIAECLMWDYDKVTCEQVDLTHLEWTDPQLISLDDVDTAIDGMIITSNSIKWETPLQELIIGDCVYDEVYLSIASDMVGDGITHQKFNAIIRANESLTDKFNEISSI